MEEGVAVARETGDRRYIADALGVMGLLHLHEGDYPAALTCLEESLALAKEVEDSSSMAYRLADLGLLAIYQEQMEKARPLIEESLALSMQMNHQWFIASCLERLGEVVVAENQALWAAQLWGAAAAIRTALATPIPPIERAPYEAAVEAAHLQLGEELFATSWETGLSLNARQAIDLRPTVPDETRDTRPQPVIRLAAPLESDTSLTQRESEVLRLVAGGLTNLQIAEQLVISPRTVQTHLSSIYHKLAVSSRSGATRYAIEHNLA
jgi:DNA-binding CsgD family transcriptional regulator